MQHTDRDRAIALAGIFQAAHLVHQVAYTGMLDQQSLETSIGSLFKIDAATPEAVFGNAGKLSLGYKSLLTQLGGSNYNTSKPRNIDITKYVISIAVLERKLAKRRDLLKKIADGIEDTQQQLEHFGMTHDNTLAKLAHIYTETISTLKPRIMVNGEHQHISNPNQANKIRALLLAGIRAAVLWRQCGGNRWQLLLKRNIVLKEIDRLQRESS